MSDLENYEAVIGMEVHVELQTASKLFCRCPAEHFQVPANEHVCPVCTSQPGSLPVVNERAVELTVMTGMALNCEIRPRSIFARKNYVYPDLPKGYQISQYELPLCTGGWAEIADGDEVKRIGIERVHLEEDTGKLVHESRSSLVDYNRAGVPLMEIVSDSSLRSAEEAWDYLQKIRQLVRYLGASTGDMEKGAMRCEANISVRPRGASEYGTKVEVKNLNSFRSVRAAIDYEVRRQVEVIEAGGQVRQVTMGWDEDSGFTRPQRSKEYADDYRYFPDPDLLDVDLPPEWMERLAARLPELPDAGTGGRRPGSRRRSPPEGIRGRWATGWPGRSSGGSTSSPKPAPTRRFRYHRGLWSSSSGWSRPAPSTRTPPARCSTPSGTKGGRRRRSSRSGG